MRISDLPNDSRPREKAILHGFGSLSSAELIAIFINTGYRNVSALDIANHLLKKYDGLSNLIRLSKEQLTKEKGISEKKALTLLALFEVVKRITSDASAPSSKWNPSQFFKANRFDYIGLEREKFVLYLVNSQYEIKKKITLYEGNISGFDMSLHVIFHEAVLYGIKNIVIVHNHPSQLAVPSTSDVQFTLNLYKECKKLGLTLVDHIIFTDDNFFSFYNDENCSSIVTQ